MEDSLKLKFSLLLIPFVERKIIIADDVIL